MLTGDRDETGINDHTIELITDRVIAALHSDLEAITAELAAPSQANDQLTVEQVARRLGVARSTVYAHWRDWGGYKIGAGPKARIRFDSSVLPLPATTHKRQQVARDAYSIREQPRRRRTRRDLLAPAPRLVAPLDEVS